MALSIASYEPADWFNSSGTSRTVTGVSWASGDIIVAIGGTENASYTLGTPSNANLTFSLGASVTTGGTNECTAYVWTATAGSSQSSQTITTTISTSGKMGGLHIWVISGSPSGTTGAAANQTETAPSLTVGAGDAVCYGLFDWNATTPTKTPATGSGTATERADVGNGSEYGVWAADWLGTSAGTFSFGPNNYTGLKVAHAYIIVQAPASSDTNADAETTSATATANNATSTVDTDAEVASATATAYDATVTLSVDANAEVATATAAALDATSTVDTDAEVASAVATAHDATVQVDTDAESASATATANDATVTTDSKWENYTHDFPGSSLDTTFWPGSYGDAVTVSGNKATFPSATVTYSGISTSTTGNSLIGSYVIIQLDPRSTGGFSGITVKDDGTNVDILAISYRHTAGQLEGAYNGSDWSDTDSSATVAFTDAGVWFRLREASGTGYMEYSADGSSWTVLHSDTMSASALTALAGCKVELNCGPFSSSMTTGPSFANFNLPPTGTNADAETTSATAAAQDATSTVDTDSEAASAAAAAQDATSTVDTDAEVASAVATAHDATVDTTVTAIAEVASAVATAHDATVTVDTDAEVATAVATAHDGTVSTAADTNADAEAATAAAAAQDASSTVDVDGEVASATAAAQDATAALDVDTEAASAVATAYDATVETGVAASAEVATVTATAHDATVSVSTDAEVATAVAGANDPVVAATTAPSPVMDVDALTAYAQTRTLRGYAAEPAVRSYEALAPTLTP